MSKINWNFDNTYSYLSNAFKENINPIPVIKPELILINKTLAKELSLDISKVTEKELFKRSAAAVRNMNDALNAL